MTSVHAHGNKSVAKDAGRVEALRNEHLRRALNRYATRTAPALNIDSYAERVYRVNRASGL
jgi:hypothetical protein